MAKGTSMVHRKKEAVYGDYFLENIVQIPEGTLWTMEIRLKKDSTARVNELEKHWLRCCFR